MDAGFQVVRFSAAFPGEKGIRQQSVKDPEVIAFCNKHGYILITTDGNMIKRHRSVIEKSPNLGILATTHNNAPDIMVWVKSLIQLKPKLEHNNFKKRIRPWFGTFDTSGRFGIPIRTILPKSQTELHPAKRSTGASS
jgi:predicted nuclease of predicted toxin-antitoxin system